MLEWSEIKDVYNTTDTELRDEYEVCREIRLRDAAELR